MSSVALGSDHSIALKADGSIWVWGYAGYYQLGDGTQTHRNTPFELPSMSSIAAVGAGHNHSLAVTTAGVVSVWGNNAYGQLGDGTQRQRSVPTNVSATDYQWKVATPALSVTTNTFFSAPNVTVTVDTPGAVIHYTDNGADPTEADPIVASGSPIAVNTSRTLKAKAWKAGAPESNVAAETYTLQVSPPSFSPYWATTYTTPQTVTMSASAGTTIRFTTDGSTPTASSTLYTGPITVGTATTLKAIALKDGWTSSGVATAIYTMNFGTLAPPTMTPAAGTYQSSATVEMSSPQSGAVIRYTTNGLPPGSGSPIYTGPITVDASMTLKAKAFHPDYVTSAETSRAYTITVAPPTFSVQSGAYPAGHVVTITTPTPGATISYTIHGTDPTQTDRAIVSGGTLVLGNYTLKAKAWKSGATASAVTSATYTVTGSVATPMVAAGGQHSLLTAADGVSWGWGRNGWGQLADGTTTSPRLSPRMLAGLTGIAAVEGGADFSVLLKTDGTIYAAGTNGNGQLGDGTTTYRTSAVSVSGATTVSAIAAGDTHALAVKADGTVIGWGANYYGQVGDGTTMQRLTPTPVTGLTMATAVAAGAQFSLARLQGGTVVAWGYNAYSQLGDGSSTNRATPVTVSGITTATAIAAGDNHALAVLADGSVRAWGHGFSGQLGDGSSTTRSTPVVVSGLTGVVAVAAGQYHSLALKSDGSVYGFGQNAKGQLGDGTTTNRSIPVQVPNLANIVTIAAGQQHSLALEDDGTLWVWGANLSGQIGDGTTTDRLSPTVIAELGTSWRVAAPTISLASSTYSADQTATIAVSDPEATIHYTQNGEEPTETDPTITSGATVTITSSQTLKAKAWKPWVLASTTASATYVLKPTTPTMSPDSGTHSAQTAVTLSTMTSGATLRYTTDGTDPTVSSTVYSVPITVATTTTLKAAAFKSGWTTSDVRTATYTMNFGTLAAPILDPASGSYEGTVMVTMTAPEGATVHYTTDGSEPTSASAVYTTPVSLGVGSFTVAARAFKVDWTASTTVSASYVVTSNDSTPPTITANLSPAPNAAGWNSAVVTVTFSCSDGDSAITSCGPERTVAAEGTTTVAGTAVDAAGNTATTEVVVRIDWSPPLVTRYAPRDTDVFAPETSSVTVRGSAPDFGSGIEAVTCNGVAAVMTAQNYSCALSVGAGSTPVSIVARDYAGLTATADATIEVGEAPLTSLEVTPATATLIAGESRTLHVIDQRGERITGGTWSVSDGAVAEVIVNDGVASVHALANGDATLTLTRNALTSEASVHVLAAGSTIPSGTTLWSLSGSGTVPHRAQTLRPKWVDTDREQPSLFFIDEGIDWAFGAQAYNYGGWIRPYGTQPTDIRATTADGRQLWRHAFTGPIVEQYAADEFGGMVLLVDHDWSPSAQHVYKPHVVRRIDGPTGQVNWEYHAYYDSNNISRLTNFAIAPDGRTFFVERRYQGYSGSAYLIAIDGTGAISEWMLPSGDANRGPRTTAPVVLEDGSVALVLSRYRGPAFDWSYELQKIVVPPGGSAYSVVSIASGSQTRLDVSELRLMPDGANGLLLTPGKLGNQGGGAIPGTPYPGSVRPDVFRVDSNNTLSGPLQLVPNWGPMGNPWVGVYQADVVLGDDAAWAYLEGFEGGNYWAKTISFDPITLSIETDTPLSEVPRTEPWYLRLRTAVGGGGVYLSGPTDAFAVGATVDASNFGAGGNSSSQFAELWTGWGTNPALAMGSEILHSSSDWSSPLGESEANRVRQRPRTADSAAVSVLRQYNLASIVRNREYAGQICQQAPDVYFATVPNSDPIFSDTAVASTCPVTAPWVGQYHTHGRDGNEGFSSRDISNANAAPGQAWYVATPCGNIYRYVGPVPPGDYVRLREQTESPIRCTP